MSQTELLPVASDDAQKTQKDTERAPKVLEMGCGSHCLLGFFFHFFSSFLLFLLFFFLLFFFIFFFAKIPKAGGKHTESKRLAQSPNTVVQLKS